MKFQTTILTLLIIQVCHSQELDIFQNDSIYSKSSISKRTMYSQNGNTSQRELVTFYNSFGKKTKQFWYWNGDKDFHNVETFEYSVEGLLSSKVDSIRDGTIETTSYFYENNSLKQQITLNQNLDTCDFRSYLNKNTTVNRWYSNNAPYRYDTILFERENVKLEYYGIEYTPKPSKFSKVLRPEENGTLKPSNPVKWHYNFINRFDPSGNLSQVSAALEKPYSSFIKYTYDNRNLLIKKQEIFILKGKEVTNVEYIFVYE